MPVGSSTWSRSARSTAAQSDCNCTVIDLRSRHLAADEARRRIIATTSDAHRMHKIDSTLRGNWAAELAALVDGGRRVVLIPSHPRAGRVCVHGVVYVNGVPVAESDLGNDPRLPVRSSRPSETLPATEVPVPDELVAWLAMSSAGVAIVDATTLDEIHELVQIALHPADVVLSGPASVVEAVADTRGATGTGAAFFRTRCCRNPWWSCAPACTRWPVHRSRGSNRSRHRGGDLVGGPWRGFGMGCHRCGRAEHTAWSPRARRAA